MNREAKHIEIARKILPRPLRRFVRQTYKAIKNLLFEFSLLFRRKRYDGKVFCIGFNKTGTTSLGKALQMLGYRHSSFNKRVWRKYYKNNEIEKILKYTAKFDSVDDLPWLKEDMIPLLDEAFPGSKFIYLTRDEESWKNSIYTWTYQTFGKKVDKQKKLEEFRQHRDFVIDYFRDRDPQHFIVLDIKDKAGYKKLADFLGRETDCESFPHFNQTRPK